MSMKHSQVLKRAWKILWNYRTLWVFGILLSLAVGGASGQSSWSSNSNHFNDSPNQSTDWTFDENEAFWPQFFDNMDQEMAIAREEFDSILSGSNENVEAWETAILRAAIAFAIIMVIIGIITKFIGYVAQTSVVKMVSDYEETGEKRSVREGWRMGWSRQAWRLFLVDLIIGLPAFILFIVVMALAMTPIISSMVGGPTQGMLGLVASIGLMVLFGLFAFFYTIVFSLTKPVIYRKVVLEDTTAFEGLKEGFRMFGQYWKEYGLLWLIMKGIDLLWPIVMIPFTLLTGVIGLTFGGGIALLTGGNAMQNGDPAMVWSIMLGIVLVIIIVGIPLAFVGGFRLVYQSTSWTLSYRELLAVKALQNGDSLELETGAA